MRPSAAIRLALAALAFSGPALAETPYRHAEEPIGTVEQIYDGDLLPDDAVATFRNIDRLFPTRSIAPSATPRALEPSDLKLGRLDLTLDGKTYDLDDVIALDSRNCLIRSDGPLVAAIGIEDLVIVATADAILVVPRAQAQRVKDVVERLKQEGRDLWT